MKRSHLKHNILKLSLCFALLLQSVSCGLGQISIEDYDNLPAVMPQEGVLVISALSPLSDNQPPVRDDQMQTAFESEANIRIEMQYISTRTYAEALDTMIASQSTPMMVEIPPSLTVKSSFFKYCSDGVFWDITDIITSSNLEENGVATDDTLKATLVYGRNYFLAQAAPNAGMAVIYRQDWAERVVADDPTSVEAFYEMSRLFSQNDPDGNGKDDTYGFVYAIGDTGDVSVKSGFDTVAVALGAPNVWGIDSQGDYFYYAESEGYLLALELFRNMYKNGYMNNDFYLINYSERYASLLCGQAGMVIAPVHDLVYPGGKFDTLFERFPDAKLSFVQVFETDGVPVTNSVIHFGALGGTAFSKASCSESDLTRIFMLFDLSCENEELQKILLTCEERVGINAQSGSSNIKMYNGTWSLNNMGLPLPQPLLAGSPGTTTKSGQDIIEAMLLAKHFTVADLSLGLMNSVMAATLSSIEHIILDAHTKYILGHVDKEFFFAAVEKWKGLGGQIVIDALTQLSPS